MIGTPEHNLPTLSPEDIRILDLIAEDGFDPARVAALPDADRARGDALTTLLGRLDAYPVTDGDDALVDATLARIDRHDAEQQSRLRLVGEEDAARSGWRLGFRMADLVTLAAVILVGVSVISPVMTNVRFRAQQTACSANLAALGGAFFTYTREHDGLLPMVRVARPWNHGGNVDNLSPLVDGGYCSAGHLHCAGHSGDGCGYGYRLLASPTAARLDVSPTLALLADRNPAVDRARAGLAVLGFEEASANHGGRGQHVLFGDLALVWTVTPVVTGPGKRMDNIWLLTVEGLTEDLRPDTLPAEGEQFVTQ
jgi:hypothetical protein